MILHIPKKWDSLDGPTPTFCGKTVPAADCGALVTADCPACWLGRNEALAQACRESVVDEIMAMKAQKRALESSPLS